MAVTPPLATFVAATPQTMPKGTVADTIQIAGELIASVSDAIAKQPVALVNQCRQSVNTARDYLLGQISESVAVARQTVHDAQTNLLQQVQQQVGSAGLILTGAGPATDGGPCALDPSVARWYPGGTAFGVTYIGYYRSAPFPGPGFACAPPLSQTWPDGKTFYLPTAPPVGGGYWALDCSGHWSVLQCPGAGGGGSGGGTVCVPEYGCHAGSHWDSVQCKCVPDIIIPPPPTDGTGDKCCPAITFPEPCYCWKPEDLEKLIDRALAGISKCFCPEQNGNGEEPEMPVSKVVVDTESIAPDGNDVCYWSPKTDSIVCI